MFTKETAAAAGKASKRGVSERTKVLNELFKEETAKEIFEQVVEKALAGDMEAIKLYMAYCFGKPTETVDVTSGGEKLGYQVEVIRPGVGLNLVSNGATETAN